LEIQSASKSPAIRGGKRGLNAINPISLPKAAAARHDSDSMKKYGKWWAIAALACLLAVLWFALQGSRNGSQHRGKASSKDGASGGNPTAPAAGIEHPVKDASVKIPEGINAADLYKNAFVLYQALSPEEKEMLNHPKEEVDEDKAEALFQKIQPILALLHEAANADYCDWCMGSMKFDQPTTHVIKGVQLGKLSLWAAGFQFPTNPEAALDALADQNELGRSIGGYGMVGILTEASLERGATQLIRQNSAAITPALAAQFKEMLQSSTMEKDAPRAMAAELEGFNAQIQKLEAPGSGNNDAEGDAQKQLIQDPVSQPKIEQARQAEMEFPKMLQATDAEFELWMDGIKNASADNPFLMVMDVFRSVRNRLREATIERTMLGAGIDVMQNGPAQVGAFMEPGSQTPFIYRQTADGFELQSRAQFKGKPIILHFPNPASP
jgi:hypothetical protein